MKIIPIFLTTGAAGMLVGGCNPSPTADSASATGTNAGATGSSASSVASASELPLTNTVWQLVELDGKPVPATTGLRTPTLQLDASGRATGTSGINRYNAGYELTAIGVNFAPGVGTKMAGTPAAMEVESAYLKALTSVSSWNITSNRLELKSADKTVLRFRGQ